jgi:hypothetical protein
MLLFSQLQAVVQAPRRVGLAFCLTITDAFDCRETAVPGHRLAFLTTVSVFYPIFISSSCLAVRRNDVITRRTLHRVPPFFSLFEESRRTTKATHV